MGISGLLPMLKGVQECGHISHFKGKRLAVDAYVWLHKGAFGCAEALVKGEKTTKFVDYAMHRVRLLRHFGIIPYIVFDGGPLPAKKGTEVSRAKSRAENLARAQSLESQGRKREARDCYAKCLDITPEMAYQLIKALRAEEVQYVVAPYEADAQLCYLEREGFVDGIITEDSDLLVFGCEKVIFKMDGNGQCVWIDRQKLGDNAEYPMHGWTNLEFRRMAMLSGCDYLPSIPGVGLKTAHRLLRRHKTVEKVLQTLRLEGTLNIPPTYLTLFAQAELAFVYQRVFCPRKRMLVPLNDFPEEGLTADDEGWIGLDVEPQIARGMSTGGRHPETKEVIEDLFPSFAPVSRKPTAGSSKKPLGESASQNVAAGPMDAFVKRGKAVVKPIGRISSGVTRLADQALFSSSAQAGPSRDVLPPPQVTARKTFSKFFSKKTTAQRELELAIEEETAKLVWMSDEVGPDIDSQTPGRRRRAESLSDDAFSSPPHVEEFSPPLTPSSAPKSRSQDSDGGVSRSRRPSSSSESGFSHPPTVDASPSSSSEGAFSHPPTVSSSPHRTTPLRGLDHLDRTPPNASLSSPIVSSPVSVDSDPFSPPSKTNAGRRFETSSDHTPHESQSDIPPESRAWDNVFGIFVDLRKDPGGPPLSKAETVGPWMQVSERSNTDEVTQSLGPGPDLVQPSRPPRQSEPVLVPPSSPQPRFGGLAARKEIVPADPGLAGHSSDSVDEEELRTPSAELLGKRMRADHVFEDPDEVIRRQEEAAKKVAAGWNAKWSFTPPAFPAPRSTRVSKIGGMSAKRSAEFSPLTRTKVLSARSPNIPMDHTSADDGPVKKRMKHAGQEEEETARKSKLPSMLPSNGYTGDEDRPVPKRPAHTGPIDPDHPITPRTIDILQRFRWESVAKNFEDRKLRPEW